MDAASQGQEKTNKQYTAKTIWPLAFMIPHARRFPCPRREVHTSTTPSAAVRCPAPDRDCGATFPSARPIGGHGRAPQLSAPPCRLTHALTPPATPAARAATVRRAHATASDPRRQLSSRNPQAKH